MTDEQHPAHVAASVRQRLLNVAKERGDDFQGLLVRYGLERLLYRLSRSTHAEKFVLKGALLFQLWFDLPQRATRDADFLGFGNAEPEHLAGVFREIAAMSASEFLADGLEFHPGSVRAEPIREAASYPGVRVTLGAELARARIPIQCDIGFGDLAIPKPELATMPVLIGLPAPTLRVYSQETVVAEKLEAMVKLSAYNSRMKDYFDIYYLFVHGSMHRPTLEVAIRRTFERRGTPPPTELPAGLTDEFAIERQRMWQSFITRNALRVPDLQTVIERLRKECWPSLLNSSLARRRKP